MQNIKDTFSSFSVDDTTKAEDFYSNVLGFEKENNDMGLAFKMPGGGRLFIYQKDDHTPASFTVLNLVVGDIGEVVKELNSKDVKFDEVDFGGGIKTDQDGIMRGLETGEGPDIAWFKDPAGNVLSVIQNQ